MRRAGSADSSAEFVGVAEKGDRQLRFGILGLCGGRTDRGHCAADRGLDLGEETGSGATVTPVPEPAMAETTA